MLLSVSQLSLLSSRWSLVVGTRGYWWGHRSVQDAEQELALREQMKVVNIQDAPSHLTAESKMTYVPARILQEADALELFDNRYFCMADIHHRFKRPWIPVIQDYDFHIYRKQINSYNALVRGQLFLKERLMTLGPDLAAAHFLLERNCRIRFKGYDQWLDKERIKELRMLAPNDQELNVTTTNGDKNKFVLTELPHMYQPGYYIEAIDASESSLVYEGFQNLRNLMFLTYLDLSYSPEIDAWCLDRICGEYYDTLEYLDLSGCVGIEPGALECLWRLKCLKTLVLYDMDHMKDICLICLLLLEVFPDLEIRGIDYMKLDLLKGTEHEALLEDYEQALLKAPNRDQSDEQALNSDDNHPGFIAEEGAENTSRRDSSITSDKDDIPSNFHSKHSQRKSVQ